MNSPCYISKPSHDLRRGFGYFNPALIFLIYPSLQYPRGSFLSRCFRLRCLLNFISPRAAFAQPSHLRPPQLVMLMVDLFIITKPPNSTSGESALVPNYFHNNKRQHAQQKPGMRQFGLASNRNPQYFPLWGAVISLPIQASEEEPLNYFGLLPIIIR